MAESLYFRASRSTNYTILSHQKPHTMVYNTDTLTYTGTSLTNVNAKQAGCGRLLELCQPVRACGGRLRWYP